MRRAILLSVAFAVVGFIADARCEIRVEDDEVIFTLRAPGARTVFLIGDFNNWNPTVEPLPRDGDVFEISLFLVEGSYRYKFVVDGRTIVDPSNPGEKPALGSPLTLIERAVGLVLSTEEEPAEGVVGGSARGTRSSFRYIGEFRDEKRPFQRTEFAVRFARDRLSGRGLFASDNRTWSDDFEDVSVAFDRGHVAVDGGAFEFRGFDNDSTWASSDPLMLVGSEGVFAYNAGFGRKGMTISTSATGTIVGRVLYSDNIGRNAGAPVIASDALSGFVSGTTADTTIYAYSNSLGGADRLALEIMIDTGQLRGGYVRRTDRGLHPGLLAEVFRDSASFDVVLSSTREENFASLFWLSVPNIFGTRVTVGYGNANTELIAVTTQQLTSNLSTDIAATGGVGSRGESVELVDSRKVIVEVGNEGKSVSWGVSWNFSQFDFGSSAAEKGSADIHRIVATVAMTFDEQSPWKTEGEVGFTSQSYDGAPDDFVFDATTTNPWLSGRDNLSVERIVGLDQSSYINARATLAWEARTGSPRWAPTRAVLAASTVFDDNGSPDYLAATMRAQRVFATNWTFFVDGRAARYDRPSARIAETFWSGYVECGYQRTWFGVNLGYGFDPIVFDATVSDYNDIGRTRALRSTLESGVRRSNADGLVSGLVEAERRLEGDNTIKLECIFRF